MANTKNRDLLWRVISSIVLIPPVMVVVYIGGWLFVLMIALGSLISMYEWITMTLRKVTFVIGYMILLLVIVGYELFGPLVTLSLTLIVSLGFGVYLYTFAGIFDRWWTIGGVIYLSTGVLSLLWLRDQPEYGRFLLIFLFVTVWMTDIGAFFVGRWWGRGRLAPKLSPEKTWSGFMGGLLSAVVTSWCIVWITSMPEPMILVMIALFVGILCHGGDLLVSAVKRRFHCKDAGYLIPGHGGVIDRVDGLAAAAHGLVVFQVMIGIQSAWS